MAHTTALVHIEGVLVPDGPVKLLQLSPTPQASRLWVSLASSYECYLFSTAPPQDVELWAKRELPRGFNPPASEPHYLGRRAEQLGAPVVDLTIDAVQQLRARGCNVELFVTAQVECAVAAWNLGVPSMFYASPTYLRPEFRPNASFPERTWAQIEAEIDEAKTARANDTRGGENWTERYT